MSSANINEDLRSAKTKKALYDAMFTLLQTLNFKKITIKGICEEALISRATFYTHFIDKYDLLKHWMTELWPIDLCSNDTYENLEKTVNYYIRENQPVLKNLVYDADNETFDMLFDFILSTIDLNAENNGCEGIHHKNAVLSHFYAGGLISYISWQVNNRFPSDIPLMNRHLYEMIHVLQEWQAK